MQLDPHGLSWGEVADRDREDVLPVLFGQGGPVPRAERLTVSLLGGARLHERALDPAALSRHREVRDGSSRGQREDVDGLQRVGKGVDESLAQRGLGRQAVNARLDLCPSSAPLGLREALRNR